MSSETQLASPEVVLNDAAVDRVPGAVRRADALDVHRRLPGYVPSPLLTCPQIAQRLGVGEVWVKDESWRLGLPSFKMLGASYAIYRALIDRLGRESLWRNIDELRVELAELGQLHFAAATDGNHGRAVARMARLLGYGASIYVPEGMTRARIQAIESEGATVTVVAGDYDEAVRRSAQDESSRCLVISDTSWPGYEQVPTRVFEGYSTIFGEVSGQLAEAGTGEPSVVMIPIGVGALAAATVSYYKAEDGAGPVPKLIGVEPTTANCMMASIRAGHLVTVPGPHTSIMVGLNCGTASRVAWPLVSRGLDAIVAVDDGWARQAMRELAHVDVVAGETGAASLAALAALMESDQPTPVQKALGLDEKARVLVLCTEGATDPQAWSQIVGKPVPAVSQATQWQ